MSDAFAAGAQTARGFGESWTLPIVIIVLIVIVVFAFLRRSKSKF